MATATPWGTAQRSVRITTGVMAYSTAGHGGVRISPGRAKTLSPAARALGWDYYGDGALWYEEDCLYAVPLYDIPEWGKAANCNRADLENTIQRWNPAYFGGAK